MAKRSQALPWKKRLLLVFLGVLFASVGCELGLRAVAAIKASWAREPLADYGRDGTSGFLVTYDADLGYRLTPGYPSLNSDGLKDHPIPPKDARFRILFLGDSVAYRGRDVDDTLVAYMRRELQRNEGLAPVAVINAGIPGYTNWQELVYLKKYGLKFEPDLVGVQFCLNDLPKVLHRFNVQDGRIVPGPWYFADEVLEAKREILLVRLARKSHLLRWLHEHIRLARRTAEYVQSGGYTFDHRPDFYQAWKEEWWFAIESQLREMVELGKGRGFPVFVVVFPMADQYREDYLLRDRDYVLKPQRRLSEICSRLGIPIYDLYPEMQATMFLTDGIHLTEAARPVVGEKIAAFLIREALVPRAGRERAQRRQVKGSP